VLALGWVASCRNFSEGPAHPQGVAGEPAAGDEAGGTEMVGGAGARGDGDAVLSVTNGLLLWLRADRGITLDKGSVVEWKDQSPNHLDATRIDSAPPPTFKPIELAGQPGVSFDGATQQHLALPQLGGDFKQGLSVFALLQRDDALNACEAVLSASNGVEMDDITLAVRMNAAHYEVADQFIDDANHELPSHAPKIVRVLQPAGGVTYVSIDGQAAGEAQLLRPVTIDRKDVFLGHSLYADCGDFNGTVGEILLYDRELDPTEVDDVDAYLRKHWGKE
jgi:hypothetical protein